MRPLFVHGFAAFLIGQASVVSTAGTLWVPAVAHTRGVGTSQWRSDVGILNQCPSDSVVEIRLHTRHGLFSESFTVGGGKQQIFTDVVAQLTSGNVSGSLEVRSDTGVTVSSRTYNQSELGTYGMGLDGVGLEAGFQDGSNAILQQLREDSSFRTNIGILNMGSIPAILAIELFDRNGFSVGEYQLEIPTGEMSQDNRPFRKRFGRTNIIGGYAQLTVISGYGVYPYATVIDNETDDPAAILGRSAENCPGDIEAFLEGIEGMAVEELPTDYPGYRYFELHFSQPADHNNPTGERFDQYITLLHTSHGAPVVLRTLGYHHRLGDYKAELTEMLAANQLVVEHRFFETSTPTSGDWSLLDIRQAAADHHRITAALKPFYAGVWLNTGHSKGGMAAVFHRRFFPDDVFATVAYVAPISHGAPDNRYVDFLAGNGTVECNEDLWDLQREALGRREALTDLFQSYADNRGYTYYLIGGLGPAFESVVMELPFTFWQYAGLGYCSDIPDTSSSDSVLFGFYRDFVGWFSVSDSFFDSYGAYYYQAHDEFGFPAVTTDRIEDLMHYDPPSPEEGVPPPGSIPTYNPTVMADIALWIATDSERMVFVYGEFDPWTAGAVSLGSESDSFIFFDPGGNHGAQIATLEPDDRETVMQILHRWTGVDPVPAKNTGESFRRFPLWGRTPVGNPR